jgi:phage terminase large subunit
MSSLKKTANVQMPVCVAPLAEPHRYYVLYGGRNGVKSWSVARHLVIRGASEPIRWLCTRETMLSISDSVHSLLEDQIKLIGLQSHYEIQKNAIYGHNGTRFVYAGLRGLKNDKTALKSYESFDGAWVEEAQSCSHSSWQTLIPTIRKAGSRIIVTFNPELTTDDTYQRFLVHTPPDTCLIHTSYRDNPWLSVEARADMDHLKATDPEEFEHVYEGACVQNVKGAVFAKEMRLVDSEQRIRAVPYNNSRPVDTFWDIGDRWTAIWLCQQFPFETRMLEYCEYEAASLADIVRDLQGKGYLYGCHWLPHDARAPQLSTGRTIEEQLRSAGYKVQVVPRVSVSARLNMLRLAFPQLWFDGDKCADGLQRIRHYRWSPEGTLGIEHREPLHDVNSHGVDALSYGAVVIKTPTNRDPLPQRKRPEVLSPWV